MSHLAIGAALGSHRVRGTSSLRVTEGGSLVESLTDEVKLALASSGNFHGTLENSESYGKELYFVDGELYLRPRFGRFQRRPPTTEREPGAMRSELVSTPGAYFELLAPGVLLRDGGTAEVAGRSGRAVELAMAPRARARAHGRFPAEMARGRRSPRGTRARCPRQRQRRPPRGRARGCPRLRARRPSLCPRARGRAVQFPISEHRLKSPHPR